MATISPCRTHISDRFPVASFVVRVPPARCFEVACATDPNLFHPRYQGQRNSGNFFTTRGKGLLRAPAGEATVLLPPAQLQRFAGSNRLYYALGTYGNPSGEGPRFTLDPQKLEEAPYLHLASDFTGRSLSSTRWGTRGEKERQDEPESTLTWGGDLLYTAALRSQQTPTPPQPAPRRAPAPPSGSAHPDEYEAAPSTWREPPPPPPRPSERRAHNLRSSATTHPDDYFSPTRSESYGVPPRRAESPPSRHPDVYGAVPAEWSAQLPPPREVPQAFNHSGEPQGYEDARSLRQSEDPTYGGRVPLPEPEGYEDARSLQATLNYGRGPLAEPEGYEDARSLQEATPTHYGAGLEERERSAEPTYGARRSTRAEPIGYEDASGLPDNTLHPASEAAYGQSGPRRVPVPGGIPLTPQEMSRIVRPVFRLNGGLEGYGRTDVDQRGLVWGMANFNPRDGSLQEVLRAAWRRDQAWYAEGDSRFEAVFGGRGAAHIQEFIERESPETWMDPVGSERLTSSRWVQRFALAGNQHRDAEAPLAPSQDPFKVAQNEVAITRHLIPALPLAQELGLNTDRGLAMIYDRVVQTGQDEAGEWFRETLVGRSAGTSSASELKGDLSWLVEQAESQGRPWSQRLRAILENENDLNDTVYDLDA